VATTDHIIGGDSTDTVASGQGLPRSQSMLKQGVSIWKGTGYI